jgi:hypothetical protein
MLTLAIKSRFGRPFNADTWPLRAQNHEEYAGCCHGLPARAKNFNRQENASRIGKKSF